jgi:hypothetical protein
MQQMMLQNISFYGRNKDQINKIYKGKYLVIKDEKISGVFNSWREACLQGLASFGEDSFLVKYCA